MVSCMQVYLVYMIQYILCKMCIGACIYMYILVKLPRECITEKIVRGCGREANIARGAAECYITTRDHTQVQSFP